MDQFYVIKKLSASSSRRSFSHYFDSDIIFISIIWQSSLERLIGRLGLEGFQSDVDKSCQEAADEATISMDSARDRIRDKVKKGLLDIPQKYMD